MTTWQIVAHVSEVAKPGDFVTLPAPNGGQIVVSNFDDLIKVWDGRCPHRGARIHTEPSGNARPVCAYHGRCAHPSRVRAWPTLIQDDWVMTQFENDEGCGEVPAARVPRGMTLWGRLDLTMDCSLQVAIENALDFEHVKHVHPESLAMLKLSSRHIVLLKDGSSVQSFHAGMATRLEKLASLVDIRDTPIIPGYVHAFYAPGTCLSSTAGYSYSLQNYFPTGDCRTHFVHRMYVPPHSPRMKSFYASAFAMNRQVFEEDAAVCARMPKAGPIYPTEPHESRIAHYRASL